MSFCVVIPVHNEAKAIGSIVEKIKAKELQVIVVDDGSSDGSESQARDNGAFVIRHQTRNGKGYSLQTGFREAMRQGYEGVVAMDGDGQHDVDDIDNFLRKAQENPHSVITGNRMATSEDMPLIRLLTNKFMSSIISLICKQKIPDSQCGFRYLGRRVLDQIELKCDAFETETEMLIEASKKGFPIHSVPVKTIYRDEDSKINPLKDTIRFFSYILKELFKK